jgi:hypothetical protein
MAGYSRSFGDLFMAQDPAVARSFLSKKKGYLDKEGNITRKGKRAEKLGLFSIGMEGRDEVAGRITELQNKTKGSGILESMGVDQGIIDMFSDDASVMKSVVSLKAAGKAGAKALQDLINKLIELHKLESEDDVFDVDAAVSAIDDAFQMLEKEIRDKNEAIIEGYQEQADAAQDIIDLNQKTIDLKQEEIDDLEHLNDLDQQRIDDYERQIEMEQRKIDALQREDEMRQRQADALQRQLDELSRAEQVIKDAYQKRIDALEQVAKINDHILQSQQDQLNIAKAISEGDVYAAAAAAAEMQRNQVTFAADQNKNALQTGMENAVNGLTGANGQTRAQIEAQIQAIQDQSYQTSLQIRDIEDYIYELKQTKVLPLEDAIYARGLTIRDIQGAIYDIQENTIEVQESIKEGYEDQIRQQEKSLENELKILTVGDFTREMWEKRKDEMAKTALNAEILKLKLDAVEQKYKDIAAAAEDAARKTGEAFPAPDVQETVTDTSFVRQPWMRPFASGGSVKKYAAGSVIGSGGGDRIHAMVAPGEFVVRKAMVDKYGLPFFESINQGAYSMPKFSQPQAYGSTVRGGSSTTVAPVYNDTYSITVNAQTNASADDIANTVMNKIRMKDNMAVRRINAY